MDYEFRRDLYGGYQAEFSMGHEAIGLWVTDELGSDAGQIAALLNKIEALQSQQCWQHQVAGREFVLTMNQSGVEVRAALLDDADDEAPDELSHYDQESEASCGLDDFRQMLEAWRTFTASPVSSSKASFGFR